MQRVHEAVRISWIYMWTHLCEMLQGVFGMKTNRLKLDKEELQILRDFERVEFESIHNYKEGIPYQTLISSTLHKLVSGKLKEVV